MAENKKEEVENLEVEALNDADLESVSGGTGNTINSTAANACCQSTQNEIAT